MDNQEPQPDPSQEQSADQSNDQPTAPAIDSGDQPTEQIIGQHNHQVEGKHNTQRSWQLVALFGVALVGGYFLFHKTPTAKEATIISTNPKAGSGHKVTLPIVIDTAGKTINAAEIYLKFDPKVVQVESISKKPSFFTLWVTDQPAFSNKTGDISFVGGIFNPGFKGVGRVGSVTLKAARAVKTELTFTGKTSVALNDGLGTSTPLQLKPIEVNIK